ncbi:uncharacterized protein GBIM_01699 [Gryllus bimaculatus]|nr:uncharacterized protein GBIM_01699 [Gryllus bimaculatus]
MQVIPPTSETTYGGVTQVDKGQPQQQGKQRLSHYMARSSQESQTMDRFVARFIARIFQPFRIVLQGDGKLPECQPPGRRTVLIPWLQAELKNKLWEAVPGARWVALTTDTWMSNRQQSFVAVTIPFVHAGKFMSGCLDAATQPGGHSAWNIVAHLQGEMDAWQIVGKARSFRMASEPQNLKNERNFSR